MLACLRPQENLTCLSLPRRKTTMRMPVKQTSSQMLKAIQPKQIGHCFFSVLIKKNIANRIKMTWQVKVNKYMESSGCTLIQLQVLTLQGTFLLPKL